MAYCIRSDVESAYGPNNVATWADLNNNGEASEITARIAWAIDRASNELNDRLRGGIYNIPFGSAPMTIRDLTAELAGVLLYESRGVTDFNPDTGAPYHKLQWHREHVKETIQDIRAGIIRLNVTTNHPKVPTVAK